MNTTEPPEHPTGRELRDEGVEAVLDADAAPHRGYRDVVEQVLDTLAGSGRIFTADHVRQLLPADVREHMSPALLPAMFRTYAVSRRIVQVGWVESSRASRRAGVLREWVGVQQAEEAA